MNLLLEFIKFILSLAVSLCGVMVWPSLIVLVIIFFKKELSNFLNNHPPTEVNLPGNFNVKFGESSDKQGVSDKTIKEPETRIVDLLISTLEDTKKQAQTDKQQLELLQLQLHLEKVHNDIFLSQYELLKLLKQSETSLLSMKAVESYYQTTAAFKNLKWELTNYLAYLFNNYLINLDSNTLDIGLNPLGEAYLEYTKNIPVYYNNY